jgi:BON domain-containing protein
MKLRALVPPLGREIATAATGKENAKANAKRIRTISWHISCPFVVNNDTSGGVLMARRLLLMIIFLVAITAVACGRSGDSANGVSELSGTPANVRSNADLEYAVKAKLKADEHLRSAELEVNADSATSEITLSGSVESEALRSKAVNLAKSVDSGVTVNDQIEVKPSGRSADNAFPSRQRYG